MDAFTIIACGMILCIAAMIQATVGFAYALFATPLLVWIGIPLQQAIVIVSIGSMIQSVAGVRSLHALIPWKDALTATALSIIFLLIGLFILKKLIALDSRYILFTVGSALCLLVLFQLLYKPQPVTKIHWVYTALAFSLSGIFSGTVGMGGPPLVLWVMAHDWAPAKMRGFYFANFLTFIPIMIGLMCVLPGFGSMKKPVLTGLAFAPVIYLGSLVGMMIGDRISKKRLYNLTCIFLLATGISAMIASL